MRFKRAVPHGTGGRRDYLGGRNGDARLRWERIAASGGDAAILARIAEPGRSVAGKITMAQVRDIAKLKMKDMNTTDLEAAAKTIAGSAKSMGLQVVE